MLDSIKKLLSYLLTVKDFSCNSSKDFDVHEEIFYYYYCDNGFNL